MALGHRILVPLDGSPFAERVLPLAVALARHAEGTLHLLAVHVPVSPPSTPPAAAAMIAAAQQRARDALDAALERAAAPLRAAGVEVVTELRTGVADLEILAACHAAGCDLIAMATHGRAGFRRLWLGSVADRIVRSAEVPVLLVSARGAADLDGTAEAGEAGAEGAAPGAGTPTAVESLPRVPEAVRSVIIALDGSAFAEEVLVPATALGEAFDADYVLFRSVPPPVTVGLHSTEEAAEHAARILEHERTEARRDLERVAADMRASGFTVTVTVAEAWEPGPTLLRLAEATPDAVIAMTTHGRTGLRRVVLGSVADKVIRASTRPVLLVRPTGRPAAQAGGRAPASG